MKTAARWTIHLGFLLSVSMVFAHGGPQGKMLREKLSDEQKQCLESILGKPGERERPSRQDRENAFKECNITSQHERPHRRPPHHENLTEDQVACLEHFLGKPDEGQRPSRDEARAADTECGIAVPDLPESEE